MTPISNASDSTKKTKKKNPSFVTPKGRALFAHIHEVDYGTDKYPNEKGGYGLTIILDADDTARLEAKLASAIEEARDYAEGEFSNLKRATRDKLGKLTFNNIYEPEYDRETDEPTGNYRWRFKTNAFTEDRSTGKKRQRHIPVFDSVNQPVKLTEELGNGSIVKVAFCTCPYFVEGQGMGGLSMYLNAVQLLTLVKAGERDATAYGFSEEEEGYQYQEDDAVEEHSSPSGTVSGSESNDDYTNADF